MASAALQGSPPVSPVYLFRLGFGAGLSHWNSRLQPQTFHISVILRGCVASREKSLFYGQLHGWEQLWHCRLGTEGVKKHSGAAVAKAGQWGTQTAALQPCTAPQWKLEAYLSFWGLKELQWLERCSEWLEVKNDSHNSCSWVQRTR